MSDSRHQQELFRRLTRDAIPFEVLLELHGRCNFACRHCYVPPDDERGLPLDVLLRLVDELAEAGTLRLTLSGGEPLLHPEWARIAGHARRLGCAVQLITNGSLIDEATADTLSELHARVHVSVHGDDAASFGATTARPGAFASVLRGLELMRDRGVHTDLVVPVTRLNIDHVGGVFALAESLGFECHASPCITPRRDGGREPVDIRLDDDALRSFVAKPCAGTNPLSCDLGEPTADEPLCAAGSRLAVITPQGDVLACSDLPQPAGNVLRQTFGKIWRDSPWLRLLRALRRRDLEKCDTCSRFAYCGRCPALALAEDGSLTGPSSWACRRAAALEYAHARGA